MGPKKHHSFFKFKGLKYFTYFAAGSFVFLYIFMGTQGLDADAVQAYSSNGRRITAANISNEVNVVTEAVASDAAAANGGASTSGGGGTDPNAAQWTVYLQDHGAGGPQQLSSLCVPNNDCYTASYGAGTVVYEGGCGLASTFNVLYNYSTDKTGLTLRSFYDYYVRKGFTEAHSDPNAIPNYINDNDSPFRAIHLKCSAPKYSQIKPDELDEILAKGGCVIVDMHWCTCGGSSKPYTWAGPNGPGHYVTIYAGNQRDGYKVADPAGKGSNGNSASQGKSEYADVTTAIVKAEYVAHGDRTQNCSLNFYWYEILPE